VTAFIVVCAAMVAAALLWLLLPLWQARDADVKAPSPVERRTSTIVIALSIPLLAIALYGSLSNWDWNATQNSVAQKQDMDEALRKLEARLAENPSDVNGWLLLGRSYMAIGRSARATDAFQQAYDLSKGENVEAVLGLAEALFLTDQTTLSGRAGQLFESALAKAPNHPKALWYGSIAALQAGDLVKGRDRLKLLLAQNPPAELRPILERQIEDLNQQLGQTGEGASSAASASPDSTASKTIAVSVSIAPEIQRQLTSPVPLFVLARDPSGGPPLAVQRHTSDSAPLRVELSERDAMMPSRTISSVPRVQIVARLSRSGTPQAQSGDFFGEADYEFGKDSGTLNIMIDRTVP
jgi:cytochrome c-type biogenesis protein CcmH